jgi:sarcosine oxidase, subunit delta
MIIIRCPYCHEQRTEEELTYGGQADIVRPAEPQDVSDQQWTEYLFMRSNPKGLLAEQWCCAFGCGQWLKVRRDSVTHEIREVLRFDKPYAESARDDHPGDGTDAAHERSGR